MPIPKTVLFFNPFEDFTAYWDKEPYTVKQGTKVYMQDWLANHIRKHLIDRELNRQKLPTNFECGDPTDPRYKYGRTQMEAQCILKESGEVEHGSETSQEFSLLNKQPEENKTHANQNATSSLPTKPWCDSCDSKGMRHKKVCPKNPANRPSDVTPEVRELT